MKPKKQIKLLAERITSLEEELQQNREATARNTARVLHHAMQIADLRAASNGDT